jgi:hypothetical protein
VSRLLDRFGAFAGPGNVKSGGSSIGPWVWVIIALVALIAVVGASRADS